MSGQKYILLGILISLGFIGFSQARYGIINQQAPEFQDVKWIQLPKGESVPEIKKLHGKVIYLYFFQAWCPGCHSHGFPTLKQIAADYAKDPKVKAIAIQTVFEGFSSNTPEKITKIAKKYGLPIPIGHSGGAKNRSAVMQDYRSGGTPWTVIIDPKGKVRFNGFQITVKQAKQLIDQLKAQKPN